MVEGKSRTELNLNENMGVVSKHAMILADTGNKLDVSPYTPDY